MEDGTTIHGQSPAWMEGSFHGEVVFNTGMTGYVESLTDPSYAGQHLMFTYPMVGNYGVHAEEFWESEKIHASGAIFSDVTESLLKWLAEQKVPCVFEIDTRELTKKIRSSGAMLGVLSTQKKSPESFVNPNNKHLVSHAMPSKYQIPLHKGKKVIAVDCGMKRGILRSLVKEGVEIKHVPFDYDFNSEEFDGLFLSNGPGNPEECKETIVNLKKALQGSKPIFGICLGAQLMALAAGAKTFKLPFGHRGHNQPCMELATGRCFMTSQNHGFAIDDKSLPSAWEISFKNLNDGTVEGIKHCTKPFSAVQFHPEAAPGPEETEYLFHNFLSSL